MNITLNGRQLDVAANAPASEIITTYNKTGLTADTLSAHGLSVKADADSSADSTANSYSISSDDALWLLNGFAFSDDPLLKENDNLLCVSRTQPPDRATYDAIWTARYGERIYNRLKSSHIPVCGSGGLGSHIAISLARLGIGALTIIDKDVVDITNLGRQAYEMSDLGKPKVEALKNILHRINPFMEVTAVHTTIDESNYDQYLKGHPYIVEAFDSAENKANLTSYVLTHYPDSILIGASGVSGYDHPNTVQTKALLPNYYQTGDGHSESSLGLLAPRVMLCAAHEATMLLHLLLTQED